ncbi:hypothetical protein GCM10023205_81810 [Yinghuangia aomiensis]|uniref:Uncharacterized protein n=1 Tax=Yinghuangia aomiensis TaxID=676205 RepID=A0ABP9IEQ2_9ACTN
MNQKGEQECNPRSARDSHGPPPRFERLVSVRAVQEAFTPTCDETA